MRGTSTFRFWRNDLVRANSLGLVLLALLIQFAVPIAHARQMFGALDGQGDPVSARVATFDCLTGTGRTSSPADSSPAGKMPGQCPLCQSLAASAAPLPQLLPASLLNAAALAQLLPAIGKTPIVARIHVVPQSRAPPFSV